MNKGFTLVELLAVITIIAMITVVAVPAAITFQTNMSKKMYCSKVETIESAGRQYGNDLYGTIESDIDGIIANDKLNLGCPDNMKQCFMINVNLLLEKKYLKPETDKGRTGEYLDPRDFSSLRKYPVLVYMENRRIYSRFIYPTFADLELCNPLEYVDSNKDLYYLNETSTNTYDIYKYINSTKIKIKKNKTIVDYP